MHDSTPTTEQIRTMLTENGVCDVPERELLELAARFQTDLEYAVGEELLRGLTDEQALDFETFGDSGDDAAMTAFINREIPDFRDTVRRLTTKALDELGSAARVFVGGGAR